MDKMYYVMDETDAPYENDENPFPRTKEDDLFLLKIAKENGLELKKDSHLYNLLKTIE